MGKGINTLVKETKDNIVKAINESKLPIAVIDLMLDNIIYEVKTGLNNTLQEEDLKYKQELEVQEQQVLWVEPPVENEE